MQILEQPINIKTLTKADLGWSKASHQTHIGISKEFTKDWDKYLGLDGYLAIKDYGFERVSIFTKPIERQDGRIDAPAIITTDKYNVAEKNNLKFKSVMYKIKEAAKYISNKINTENVLFLLCFAQDGKPIIILAEFEDNILGAFRNNTKFVKNGKIKAKLIKPENNEFEFVKNLCQFYSEIIDAGLSNIEVSELYDTKVFDYSNVEDARRKIFTSIKVRQGQSKFREVLLRNYGYKCAITGCEVLDTLEACHLFPYMGPKTNHPTNGIILRSDLHTLYDRKKILINSDFNVEVSNELKISEFYKHYDGKKISLPQNKECYPSIKSLQYNMNDF